MTYAQIIIPLNLKGTFTYKVPDFLLDEIAVGKRVLVPFGGKKIYTGIISEIHQQEPLDFIPKEIISILDASPILPIEQLNFWKWISEYYLCNIGEIYRFAFPSSLKLESETYVKLNPNSTIDLEVLDENETYLIQALEVRQLISVQEVEAFIPKKEIIKTLNSLIDQKLIVVDEKISEKYKIKEVSYLKIPDTIVESKDFVEILSSLDKAPKQKELFLSILSEQKKTEKGFVKKSSINDIQPIASATLKSLLQKSLVEEFLLETDRIQLYEGELEGIETLTDIQKQAKQRIDEAFAEDKNVLLHGVTSSGKTHIYVEFMEESIKKGKNCLFLVPEIALTKQISARLEKKYGKSLAYYHAKLSDFEKVEIWKKVRNNEIQILIGTRSSLFLPFQNLGLIIVDEEHDFSYRPKEVKPFFNAKDSALVLAQNYNAQVILGSATPSVESYYSAQKGKLAYVFLGKRFGEVDLPSYHLIDFKEEQNRKTTQGQFSNQLIQEIQSQIQQNHQSIILHNRRGYANVVECESCGHVTYCANCDVVMTYHKASNELKCHYCGQKAVKPKTCPSCHSENINTRGIGVEQIHEELEKLFPENVVDRMDVDSMRKKFAYEKLYEKIETGESDIIVGTQMISKGLDFDNIELVGIPRADSLLHNQDYRAEEKAFQLITQVAGRAGRVSGKGRVWIQTYQSFHPVFQLIQQQNITEIYQHFLEERKKFLYPPFVKMILIELKHRKEDKTQRASQFLGSVLRKYLPEECILGPERAPISRLNNLYQFQIYLKLPRNKKYEEFKKLVMQSFEEFEEITAYKSIKIDIFVDF